MARQTLVGAVDKIFHVVHSQIDRLLVVPIFGCVRAKTTGRWSMAVFAANTAIDVEALGPKRRRRVKGMTRQTTGFLVRTRYFQNATDAHRNRIRQDVISRSVAVF